jgi:hypothetical protein
MTQPPVGPAEPKVVAEDDLTADPAGNIPTASADPKIVREAEGARVPGSGSGMRVQAVIRMTVVRLIGLLTLLTGVAGTAAWLVSAARLPAVPPGTALAVWLSCVAVGLAALVLDRRLARASRKPHHRDAPEEPSE